MTEKYINLHVKHHHLSRRRNRDIDYQIDKRKGKKGFRNEWEPDELPPPPKVIPIQRRTVGNKLAHYKTQAKKKEKPRNQLILQVLIKNNQKVNSPKQK